MNGILKVCPGAFALLAAISASAGTVIYEFSGVIPPGASAHSEIADGETWTVVAEIDDSLPDSDLDADRGNYLGSVVSSSITFSGGYSQVQTQPDSRTIVSNDRFVAFPGVYFDGVSVSRVDASSGLLVQVTVEETVIPVEVLPDDSLIGPGVSFGQSPSQVSYFQLQFVDQVLAGQTVAYATNDAGNTAFSSSSPVLDSDSDGVPDDSDNCTLVANPGQIDSDEDGFGNICDADLNNNGVVNAADLGILRGVFFTSDADADLNGDGTVNFSDLAIMRMGFFQPPGPSGLVP